MFNIWRTKEGRGAGMACRDCLRDGKQNDARHPLDSVFLPLKEGPTLEVKVGGLCSDYTQKHLDIVASLYERLNDVAFQVVWGEGVDGWRAEVLDAHLCKQLLAESNQEQEFVRELFDALGLELTEATS